MTKERFRVTGKIARLLGREAVSDPVVALYEVIKNSHDADATSVKVKFDFGVNGKRIILKEVKGDGMTYNDIKNNFLVIGTYSKEGTKQHLKKTKRLKRVMMGQKGVGRFALEKLGKKVKIISKPYGTFTKLFFSIDWDRFEAKEVTVDMIPIEITENRREDKTDSGLEIEISSLRDEWTDEHVRRLIEYLKGFVLPKDLQSKNAFNIEIEAPGFGIENRLIEPELSEKSFFYLEAHLEKNEINYFAEKMGRSYLQKKSLTSFKSHFTNEMRKVSDIKCGKVALYVYYFPEFRKNEPLAEHYWAKADEYYGEDFHKQIRKIMKEKSGVKIFRGGMREFKYGDPDFDWTDRKTVSRNYAGTMQTDRIVGYCLLRDNPQIIPTTSRTEALDNDAFRDLRDFVVSTMKILDQKISDDRDALYSEWKEKREEAIKELTAAIETGEPLPADKQQAFTKAQKYIQSDIIDDETSTTLNEIELYHSSIGHFVSKHYHTFRIGGAVELIGSQIEKLDAHTNGVQLRTPKELENIVNMLRKKWKVVKTLFEALDHMEDGMGVEKYYKREKIDISVRNAIDEVFSELKDISKFEDLKLRNKIDEDLTIWTYGPVFYTVFYNLVSNSIKALLKKNDENKENVIIVKATVDDKFLKIQFADNSLVPIPEEDWEYVFQPWITTTGNMKIFKGRGIGLSFCKKLMKFVRGDITIVKPILDNGTTFSIQFPRGIINTKK